MFTVTKLEIDLLELEAAMEIAAPRRLQRSQSRRWRRRQNAAAKETEKESKPEKEMLRHSGSEGNGVEAGEMREMKEDKKERWREMNMEAG